MSESIADKSALSGALYAPSPRRIDLSRLADFFPAEDLEWKPITISKKEPKKGLAAAYITARAIMQRLDDVCGPENWWNEFRPGVDGGVLCGITIRTEHGPVTKWDGAENTDIEAVKGGLSSAMRRAAVQWGVGRYLYELPQQWVPVDQWGKFAEQPKIPAKFLPPATSAPVPEPARPAPMNDSQRARIERLAAAIGGTVLEQTTEWLNRPRSEAQAARMLAKLEAMTAPPHPNDPAPEVWEQDAPEFR